MKVPPISIKVAVSELEQLPFKRHQRGDLLGRISMAGNARLRTVAEFDRPGCMQTPSICTNTYQRLDWYNRLTSRMIAAHLLFRNPGWRLASIKRGNKRLNREPISDTKWAADTASPALPAFGAGVGQPRVSYHDTRIGKESTAVASRLQIRWRSLSGAHSREIRTFALIASRKELPNTRIRPPQPRITSHRLACTQTSHLDARYLFGLALTLPNTAERPVWVQPQESCGGAIERI